MPKLLGQVDGTHEGNQQLVKKDSIWVLHETFSRTYTVLADNVNQSLDDIIQNTPGVPKRYETERGVTCISHDVVETTTVGHHPVTGVMTILWEIVANFDSAYDQEQQDPNNPNPPKPTDFLPTLRWSGETIQEVLEYDAIDRTKPITTTADEPIFTEGPITIPVLEIGRYEPYPYDPQKILTYGNTLNNTDFYGSVPGTVLCVPPRAELRRIRDEESQTTIAYSWVDYRFKFNIKQAFSNEGIPFDPPVLLQDTWQPEFPNIGYYFREAPGTLPIMFLDKNDQPKKVRLRIDGTLAGEGEEAVFLKYHRYGYSEFNDLNLGPF